MSRRNNKKKKDEADKTNDKGKAKEKKAEEKEKQYKPGMKVFCLWKDSESKCQLPLGINL